MTFTYTVSEQDYLDFQLYTVSKLPRFKSKQRNGSYFLTICSLITAGYFSYKKDWGMVAYFGLTAVVFFLFYPVYFKWRQKVHYTKFIRRTYRSLFDREETLTVVGKNITLKNVTGTGSMKGSELLQINETGQHFFIMLKSGSSLVVPKQDLENSEKFLVAFKAIQPRVEKSLDWKW